MWNLHCLRNHCLQDQEAQQALQTYAINLIALVSSGIVKTEGGDSEQREIRTLAHL